MQIHIEAVQFNNWMRFRGRHNVKLKETTYGVQAQWLGNPRRSNYGGKTALLEGFKFVITGNHRHATEDAWITDGEKSGGVKIFLRDGSRDVAEISRTRTRGSSTKLEVKNFLDVGRIGENDLIDEPTLLKGDEAQAWIDRVIGYSAKEFDTGPFFGQKKMDQFITQQSGETIKMISRWLKLEPLELAAKSVGAQLTKIFDEVSVLQQNKSSAQQLFEQILTSAGFDPLAVSPDDVFAEHTKISTEVTRLRGVVKLFEDQRDTRERDRSDFRDAREYHRVVDQGKALRKKVEGYFDALPSEEAVTKLAVVVGDKARLLGVAEEAVRVKARALAGTFEGVCPVNGCECPIKDTINSDRKTAKIAHGEAEKTRASAEQEWSDALELHEVEAEKREQYDKDVAERTRLVEQAEKLKAAADRIGEKEEPDEINDGDELHIARTAVTNEERKLYSIEQVQKFYVKRAEVFNNTDLRIEELQPQIDVLVEAAQILGRNGAQKKIMRDAVDSMRAGANYALDRCGIDLVLNVEWEHEGGSLSRHCETCGLAFPASAKVKKCERCATERGLQLVNQFRIVPAARSGAADDLCGFVFKLASADWLRRDRDAGWAVAMIDELTASFDAENRAAVAGHLPRLLTHFGYVQAFVVSHDPAVVHACPGLLEIEAGPDSSRLIRAALKGFKGDDDAQEDVRRKDQADDRPHAGEHGSGDGLPAREAKGGDRAAHQRGARGTAGGDGGAALHDARAPKARGRSAADQGRQSRRS